MKKISDLEILEYLITKDKNGDKITLRRRDYYETEKWVIIKNNNTFVFSKEGVWEYMLTGSHLDENIDHLNGTRFNSKEDALKCWNKFN